MGSSRQLKRPFTMLVPDGHNVSNRGRWDATTISYTLAYITLLGDTPIAIFSQKIAMSQVFSAGERCAMIIRNEEYFVADEKTIRPESHSFYCTYFHLNPPNINAVAVEIVISCRTSSCQYNSPPEDHRTESRLS